MELVQLLQEKTAFQKQVESKMEEAEARAEAQAKEEARTKAEAQAKDEGKAKQQKQKTGKEKSEKTKVGQTSEVASLKKKYPSLLRR
tara:strand:+ start:318 stop:578 length:261 start_codon:yes stop_codon:yes gene_type:complete